MVFQLRLLILKENLHKANLFLVGPKVPVTFNVVIACHSQWQLWRQIASLQRKIMRQIRSSKANPVV
jgi:hypothetical protein